MKGNDLFPGNGFSLCLRGVYLYFVPMYYRKDIPPGLWTLVTFVPQDNRGEYAVISLTEKEPGLAAGTSSAAKEQRLTVTGLDEKGQMFRESAPILELDGRDCHFRSKFQPELGSWVLVEFDTSKTGTKRATLQGQVKSAESEGLAGSMFRIYVELETAQEMKIAPAPQPAPQQPKAASPVLQPPPPAQPAPVPAPNAEVARQQTETPAGQIFRVKPETNAGASIPAEIQAAKAAAPAPSPVASQFSVPKTQPEAPLPIQQPAATVPVPDTKQQLMAMKESLREELEALVQRTVSSSVEPVVRQAVETQIGANYQASIQTLNSDLTYQLVTRLVGNEELRTSIAGMAKKAVDDQIGELRTTSVEELRSNRASLAELETKMKASEAAAASALERARALEHEIAESLERLQKVVDQLNLSARSTIEKFDSHVTTQLTSWSAQFKNHVDGITREKAAQFTAGLEQQLANQVREANEVLEKLSAGLQLARGTVRVQETQWAERSRELAAEFEKEIRAVLLRLANPA